MIDWCPNTNSDPNSIWMLGRIGLDGFWTKK